MVRTNNGFEFARLPRKEGMGHIFAVAVVAQYGNDSFVDNHKFIIHSYIHTHTPRIRGVSIALPVSIYPQP
jgi:hypothetical protein